MEGAGRHVSVRFDAVLPGASGRQSLYSMSVRYDDKFQSIVEMPMSNYSEILLSFASASEQVGLSQGSRAVGLRAVRTLRFRIHCCA